MEAISQTHNMHFYTSQLLCVKLYVVYLTDCLHVYTEWPQKMYTLFTHQYLWNKFKLNFYFRVRV
jgi:hypothetical protein